MVKKIWIKVDNYEISEDGLLINDLEEKDKMIEESQTKFRDIIRILEREQKLTIA